MAPLPSCTPGPAPARLAGRRRDRRRHPVLSGTSGCISRVNPPRLSPKCSTSDGTRSPTCPPMTAAPRVCPTQRPGRARSGSAPTRHGWSRRSPGAGETSACFRPSSLHHGSIRSGAGCGPRPNSAACAFTTCATPLPPLRCVTRAVVLDALNQRAGAVADTGNRDTNFVHDVAPVFCGYAVTAKRTERSGHGSALS